MTFYLQEIKPSITGNILRVMEKFLRLMNPKTIWPNINTFLTGSMNA